ncbi:MAG: hypothetical protein ACXV3D_09745 [Halobacteriota archaeon]
MVTDLGCYYGVHFGCLCADCDPNCRRCAERLTNAVNYALHPGVNDANASTWTAPYIVGAAEAREEKMASTHFAGDHDV